MVIWLSYGVFYEISVWAPDWIGRTWRHTYGTIYILRCLYETIYGIIYLCYCPIFKTQRIWSPLSKSRGADLVRLTKKSMHTFQFKSCSQNPPAFILHGSLIFCTFILHGIFLRLRFAGKTSFYMVFSWEQRILKQKEQVQQWGGQRPLLWSNNQRRRCRWRKCRGGSKQLSHRKIFCQEGT